MSTRRKSVLPVIDLDVISDEEQLLPVVKSILLNYDTFALKNYANKQVLDSLMQDVQCTVPDLEQGFDANFTGTLSIVDGIYMEQYIESTGDSLQFNRPCNNQPLRKVYSRLFKVAMFFAKLCIKSIIPNESVMTIDSQYATKLMHYFNENVSENVLPNGVSFEYLFAKEFVTHGNTGILSVFPSGRGIKYKSMSSAADDNVWNSIEEPEDCLIFHTGEFLAKLSNGMHSTSPLKVDTNENIVELTILPQLDTVLDNGMTAANALLQDQIREFPKVAEQFYIKELSQQQLQDRIKFYKQLFTISETVLSLYSISRGTNVAPRLESVLPQMTNMMKKKITQDDFLRMLSIWPECYLVESDSSRELSIQLPKRDILRSLTDHSRKLDFYEHAENWYLQNTNRHIIPKDVPPFKINKRRGSDSVETNATQMGAHRMTLNNSQNTQRAQQLQSRYLSNNLDPSAPVQKKDGTQSDLLDRLKEKERRSAILLSDRQQKYDQFLTIKMKQVFNIISSLAWNQPYTMTYLRALTVDSLQDSNNPIGPDEAEEILLKLQNLLSDDISISTVDGGLRVLKWDNLDKQKFDRVMLEYQKRFNNNII